MNQPFAHPPYSWTSGGLGWTYFIWPWFLHGWHVMYAAWTGRMAFWSACLFSNPAFISSMMKGLSLSCLRSFFVGWGYGILGRWLYFIYEGEVLLFICITYRNEKKRNTIKLQKLFIFWVGVITFLTYGSVHSITSSFDELVLQGQFWEDPQTAAEFFRLTVDNVEGFLLFLVHFKPVELRRSHEARSVIWQVGLDIIGRVIIELTRILPFQRLLDHWRISGMVFGLNPLSQVHRVLPGTEIIKWITVKRSWQAETIWAHISQGYYCTWQTVVGAGFDTVSFGLCWVVPGGGRTRSWWGIASGRDYRTCWRNGCIEKDVQCGIGESGFTVLVGVGSGVNCAHRNKFILLLVFYIYIN